MRIVYKKKITEKLYDAYLQAKKDGKEIDKFVLTTDEFKEFYAENFMVMWVGDKLTATGPITGKYRGIPVEKEND